MSSDKTNGTPVTEFESGELDDIDIEGLVTRALGVNTKAETEEEAEPEEESEETEESAKVAEEAEESEESEETEETEESAGKSKDVLSQIDFDSLNEEQATQLGQELYQLLGAEKASAFGKAFSSSAGRDIGELRKDRAKWKEQAEGLQRQLEHGLSKLTSDNPYSNITEVDKLDKIETDVEKAHDYYQSKAINGEWEVDEDGQEGLHDGNGDFYTKKKIESSLKNMQTMIRQISIQRQKVKDLVEIQKTEDDEFSKVKNLFSWMSDEESEESKRYKQLQKDEELQLLTRIAPRLGARLNKMLAYYVDGEAKPKSAKKLILPTKPTAVSGKLGGARPSLAESPRRDRKLKERINSGEYTEEDIATMLFKSTN